MPGPHAEQLNQSLGVQPRHQPASRFYCPARIELLLSFNPNFKLQLYSSTINHALQHSNGLFYMVLNRCLFKHTHLGHLGGSVS